MLRGQGARAGVDGPPPARATSGVVDCALYRDGARVEGSEGTAELYAQARDIDGAFVWIGLHEPDEKTFTGVAEIFGLHPLAVEDVVHQEQRPKLERYEDVTFLLVRAAQYVDHAALTDTSEIVHTGVVWIFVGEHFVVTVRKGTVGELRSVRAELEAVPHLLAQGPWAVVHAVYDRVVDAYVDIAAAMQTDLDMVEASVFSRDPNLGIEQIYQFKRELMEFKAAVMPLQRPLSTIVDRQAGALPKEIRRYFRDVADHHARVVEQVISHDDLLTSILQARLAQVTVAQNNDMRKIASWAAIAALQTAIAGIYGMNFAFMPELQWRYGYPGVLTVMVLSAVALYRRLRRAGWL
ncbi:magnesium and cobalt transport protein CorA [Couchioplanes caeruleus subsp. caeruleus]|uniref:Magnesium transport protein CorA n=1 Tax=Couchioplanes caeruleus subsp. caeruleus TaxID=56427 RepID=A0A1K0FTA0_9ACTN|nr:magnesium and cobalt transport protein CorA [Couchioplanes caeruleus subsp. caeruleus]